MLQTDISAKDLPHLLSTKSHASSWKPPPLLSKSSRSSFTTKSNRQLTANLGQLSNEKLPTDFDRVATGKQPFVLGTISSTKVFKLAPSYRSASSALAALFGVLVKR